MSEKLIKFTVTEWLNMVSDLVKGRNKLKHEVDALRKVYEAASHEIYSDHELGDGQTMKRVATIKAIEAYETEFEK